MMLKQRLKNNIKYPIIFITLILILSTLGCESDDSDFSIRKGRTIAIGATPPIVRDRITFTDTTGKILKNSFDLNILLKNTNWKKL